MNMGKEAFSPMAHEGLAIQLFPKRLWLMSVVLCLLPSLLNWLGVDFSSRIEPFHLHQMQDWNLSEAHLSDEMFYALRGGFHHALLEWTSIILSMAVVVLALVHFKNSHDPTVPIIGLAIFFSGIIDTYHTLAAARLFETVAESSNLIPFTWAISRGFHALILLFGVMLCLRLHQRQSMVSLWQLVALVIALGIITASVIIMSASSDSLPQTQFPGAFITRPFDILPLLLYFPTAMLMWQLYSKKPDILKACILLSFLPAAVLEVHMAFGSSRLFDNHFNIAHLLKCFEFALVFIGFALYFSGQLVHSEALNNELDAAQQRLRHIIDATSNALMIIDRAGIVQQINPAFENIFGYKHKEILNQSMDILLPDELHTIHKKWVQGFFANPQVTKMAKGRDLRAIHKDGHKFDVEVVLVPISLQGQQYAMAQIQDITARKALEHENKKQLQQLAQTADQLSETNRYLERFAYICSHDLQEPVRTVQSFAELLERRLRQDGNELDEKVEKYIKHIMQGTTQARELIVDVLRFCRIDTQSESYEEIGLNKLFQEVEGLLSENLEACQGELLWPSQETLPSITGVPGQLRQLFMNLISNGFKFNRAEKPKVQLSLSECEKLDSTGENIAYWKISIQDNGIGIQSKDREQVFEIFKRLNKRSDFPGTGIGLAICKKIVEVHQGKISIEDSDLGGSAFIILWPKTLQGLDEDDEL